MGLALIWAGTSFFASRSKAPAPRPAGELQRLGPYRPGMDLRAAFESLPAPADRTELTLLLDNTEAWAARWRMLAAAERSIDISYFILREDLFGAAFLGHLLKKAREGVSIRLLFDGQGTAMSFTSPRGNDWLDTLANSGRIEIKIFRPLLHRYIEALLTVNPVALVASEHDKILVIDGRAGMIGGRNISAEYFADPDDMPNAFEDTDVLLGGAAIARYLTEALEAQYRRVAARPVAAERLDLASFEEELLHAYRSMDAWLRGEPLPAPAASAARVPERDWTEELVRYPRLRGALERPPRAPDARAETRLLDSRTRLEPGGDVIGEAFLRLARGARSHVLIQSPYLVLSEDAVRALAEVGARGTRITILTNSPISSDNALSQAFFLEQWPEMLARVPNLRIFVVGPPRTLHSKAAVFDDQVALVGTYNLDPISMDVNSEVMVAVWSESFARDIARHPQRLIAAGAPHVYEYRIARDAQGRPERGADGRPVVAFGPADHADPAAWRKIRLYWRLLRAAGKIVGFRPLF
ncbi:MAG TPA: phosphatidylserine/phosphatidylglycerophosphate/cardiolipin synthase family protein [Burkholderiales bacterium]